MVHNFHVLFSWIIWLSNPLFCLVADAQSTNVTIIGSPGGTPVDGSSNTYLYLISDSVTLTCTTDPPVSSASYRWDTDCTACFPYNQLTESVTTSSLTLNDAGTFTCTVIGDGGGISDPFTLRVSSKLIVIICYTVAMFYYFNCYTNR